MSIEFAPNLSKRINTQRELIKRKQSGESWGWSAGLYTEPEDDIIPGDHPVRYFWDKENKCRSVEGYEIFMLDIIDAQLTHQTQKPVVVLDAGGGAGGSLSRLALSFRKEIEASQLAFVLSNLTASPNEQLQTHISLRNRIKQEQTAGTEQLLADFTQGQALIHQLYGRIPQLREQRIVLPNGKTIPLQRNVDFLNEMRSVSANTFIPEIEIPQLEELLSPSAIYVVDTNNFRPIPDHQSNNERRQGIIYAHRFLQERRRLHQVEQAETGLREGTKLVNRIIFKKPYAPLIPLN